MKTCFHSHFYANFHASVTLVYFIGFSKKIHQNVELNNWGDIHHFGKFCSFLNWEGAVIRPQIKLRKIHDEEETLYMVEAGFYSDMVLVSTYRSSNQLQPGFNSQLRQKEFSPTFAHIR